MGQRLVRPHRRARLLVALHADTAFYPLYPLTIAGLGRILGNHYVLAGLLISLAASLGAFFMLHRLAEERLGMDGARRAVLYLAVFPMSLFLVAVYSESLFLLLALGRFPRSPSAAAGCRPGRWPASPILTRIAGVALCPRSRSWRGDRPTASERSSAW